MRRLRAGRCDRRDGLGLAVLGALTLDLACVSSGERALRSDVDRAGRTLAALPAIDEDQAERGGAEEPRAPDFDGSPDAYVAYALAHDAGLRASWERWRAASHRVARERRMPMPTLSYTVFVSPVETRVGPQRQRLGARQRFPWPGALLAGADAATAAARVQQRMFEAEALELRARVLERYWQLWLVREIELIEAEQLELFDALTELTRARLEVGKVSLADVQRLDLERARLSDHLAQLDEAELAAAARLLGAVAAPPGTEAPTTAAGPRLEQPEDDEATLRAALTEHPRLGRWQAAAAAGELRVKQARRARGPGLSLGVDWIEVGPARMSGVPDSGKDAVSVSVGVELPLWQGNYAEDQRAAEAEVAAARAEWIAARDRAAAQLSVTLSQLRDSARSAQVHADTLIPQAEGALESTIGGYATGDAELSAILLAERDLLQLRQAVVSLQAQHAQAWAALEAIVGRGVEGQPARLDDQVDRPEPEPELEPEPSASEDTEVDDGQD